MADSKGIFAVIGGSLSQLTLNIGIVGNLCMEEERTKRLARQLQEMHERIATEERMLRLRFELPALQRTRADEVSEVIGHRASSARRPEEISQRLRTSQELCRSLEEYFRFFNLPHVARFYHKLRLDLYGFERMIVQILGPVGPPQLEEETQFEDVEHVASSVASALAECPLYFILDESLCKYRDPLRLAYDAVNGGVKLLQLRCKGMPTREMLELAQRLKRLCFEFRCLLIINDRVDIALLSGADGVHLGATDLRITEARQLGPNLLVGITARSSQDALAAQAAGADYIGSGAVFSSATKPAVPVIGLAGLKSIAKSVDIPVVAIGGVTLENSHRTLESGASGFCSIQPFASRRSVKNLVKEFVKTSQHHPQQAAGVKR